MRDHVAILLGLYGETPFLGAQLDSIAGQDHSNWTLFAGCDDAGCSEAIAGIDPARLRMIKGPGRGFAANYLNLLGQVEADTSYAAFCDQDDIWHPDKLRRAIEELRQVETGTAALYVARTRVAGAVLDPRHISRAGGGRPSFANSLVQCIGGANTMVMNRAALDLLQAARHEAQDENGPASHDWWAYQIITGAGGVVLTDDAPSVLYRQHGANLVGDNCGLIPFLRRVRLMLGGRYRASAEGGYAALAASAHRMTPANQAIFEAFRQVRCLPRLRRPLAFRRAGIRRQGRIGTALFYLGAALGGT
ncbi:glycosyltransferase [Roseicyclus sp. F158]|uniref:Glycosyltransferase n=1 Tax=Tropicimonas omnivorans TaxID=3075590 RepID=A0ABU3DBI4_9RHOB|nr:glycosyltransferase [Roseicyclus sp. F158]MDT0681063.1 glycosyltransferase [Roseicyclus sp. F158]